MSTVQQRDFMNALIAKVREKYDVKVRPVYGGPKVKLTYKNTDILMEFRQRTKILITIETPETGETELIPMEELENLIFEVIKEAK